MNANEAKHEVRVDAWRERVRECRSSGLSVKVWCTEHGINTATYYRWEREVLGNVRRAMKQTWEQENGESRSMFLELPPAVTKSSTMAATGRVVAEIVKDRGVIRIYEGADAKVIRALWEAASC